MRAGNPTNKTAFNSKVNKGPVKSQKLTTTQTSTDSQTPAATDTPQDRNTINKVRMFLKRTTGKEVSKAQAAKYLTEHPEFNN